MSVLPPIPRGNAQGNHITDEAVENLINNFNYSLDNHCNRRRIPLVMAKKKAATAPPIFIHTLTEPNMAQAQSNATLMQAGLARKGYIQLRISPLLYDSQSGTYTGLRGRQINIKAFSPETVYAIMDAVEEAVVKMGGGTL